MRNPFKSRRPPSAVYASSPPPFVDEKGRSEKFEPTGPRGPAEKRTKQDVALSVGKRILKILYELVFGGRHFCCCIPVRVAVFFASLLTFVGAGFGAVVIWFTVHGKFKRAQILNNSQYSQPTQLLKPV